MKIGNFTEYKGYTGSVKYDYDDHIYYGSLTNTKDFVSYHAKNPEELYEEFKMAVDDYIKVLHYINKLN